MRSPEERAVAVAIIHLMRGVVYQEDEIWEDLRRHLGAVKDHFAAIGIDVVVDESEGYAYLRTREVDDGEEPLPRLVRRRALTYPDSLLLVLLRKRMVEFEAAGDEGQLVVTRDDIVEILRIFLAQSTDEKRVLDQVDTSIRRIAEMGFLRALRGQRNTWEVRRILKAYVDAQTLSDFSAKLSEYAGGGSGAETRDDGGGGSEPRDDGGGGSEPRDDGGGGRETPDDGGTGGSSGPEPAGDPGDSGTSGEARAANVPSGGSGDD